MNHIHLYSDIYQRLVEASDAAFILELRTDQKLSKFLSTTVDSLPAQEEWILKYKQRELLGKEFYFITENSKGEKFGLNRIYNINCDYFEIGSWLFKKDCPAGLAIMADIHTRDFGFTNLKVDEVRFEVKKENRSVIRYHKMFSPCIIRESDDMVFFSLSSYNYNKTREQILNSYGPRSIQGVV